MKQIIFFDPASNIQHSETVTDQQYVLIRSLIDMIRPIGVKPEFKVLRDKVEEVVDNSFKLKIIKDCSYLHEYAAILEKSVDYVVNAIKEGFISEERIIEAVDRIPPKEKLTAVDALRHQVANRTALTTGQKMEILPEIKSQIDPKK